MQKMQDFKVAHGETCRHWQPIASYHIFKKVLKPKTKIYILFKF